MGLPSRRDWGSLSEEVVSCWTPPPQALPWSAPEGLSSQELRSMRQSLLKSHSGSPSDQQPASKTCPASVACLSRCSSLLLPTPLPLFGPMNIPTPFLLLSLGAHCALPPECLSTSNLWLASSGQSHCHLRGGVPQLPCLRWPLTLLFSKPCLLPSCSEITCLAHWNLSSLRAGLSSCSPSWLQNLAPCLARWRCSEMFVDWAHEWMIERINEGRKDR